LYSFYAGLSVLGDSIPAFRYRQTADSLLIFPTGDPSFLHPDLGYTRSFEFLKNAKQQIYIDLNAAQLNHYGSGWAWDDYNDEYQPEVSVFPMYGNIVRFKADQKGIFRPNIPMFNNSLQLNANTPKIQRLFEANLFELPTKAMSKSQDVPFKTSKALILSLLSDTLKRTINVLPLGTSRKETKVFYSMPSDSLYKRMLQVSDNMLAEHTIVLTSAVATDALSIEKGIDFIIKKHLSDLPDQPQWVDGSGLSRYNLFTPRSTVKLLQKIYALVPQQRLFSMLAIGGKAGTIKGMYKSGEPFVFAKSGSLSNNYNLSGYLVTTKGKILLFSFMNNNYVRSTAEIRKEVERILTSIHQNY
jgi:D-alanyl-D-alanine carboxypeptidase/D-alanyl-D-alanine-endopeptidase (penicillin-binding protein 4)